MQEYLECPNPVQWKCLMRNDILIEQYCYECFKMEVGGPSVCICFHPYIHTLLKIIKIITGKMNCNLASAICHSWWPTGTCSHHSHIYSQSYAEWEVLPSDLHYCKLAINVVLGVPLANILCMLLQGQQCCSSATGPCHTFQISSGTRGWGGVSRKGKD